MMIQVCMQELNCLRIRALEWFKEEAGASAIIAVILILAVVVILGIAFKDEVIGMANDIWSEITGAMEESPETTPTFGGSEKK